MTQERKTTGCFDIKTLMNSFLDVLGLNTAKGDAALPWGRTENGDTLNWIVDT
ncbi:hypothetical protein FJQ98_11480 [Lysinibacillus agricola]|uniref:Uncharacterized protein n=1 Tax=Lysinibacillus agricola TaxID=2590012 RepID=A0ABX7B0H1_9BACI|nr:MULTISPECIES: hypothetical protein [Lysinibacillus]QQP14568.1 hypothetical protein FJQ98_11480 [Lysinibacillus agricola]